MRNWSRVIFTKSAYFYVEVNPAAFEQKPVPTAGVAEGRFARSCNLWRKSTQRTSLWSPKNINEVTLDCRVSPRNKSYTLHKSLPNKVGPVVSLRGERNQGNGINVRYGGGLGQQIKEVIGASGTVV